MQLAALVGCRECVRPALIESIRGLAAIGRIIVIDLDWRFHLVKDLRAVYQQHREMRHYQLANERVDMDTLHRVLRAIFNRESSITANLHGDMVWVVGFDRVPDWRKFLRDLFPVVPSPRAHLVVTLLADELDDEGVPDDTVPPKVDTLTGEFGAFVLQFPRSPPPPDDPPPTFPFGDSSESDE